MSRLTADYSALHPCGATDGRGFACGRSTGHTGAHTAISSTKGGRRSTSIWHDTTTKDTAPCCGPDCIRRR